VAKPVRQPAPKRPSTAREITAAGLAILAAAATVVSTMVPYEEFSTGPAGSSSFTVKLTAWRQIVSPIPEDMGNEGQIALFGIPYSLAAVVLVVSAGLLLGVAGTRGRRIARLTITAGATAALAMFGMMAANVVAFVSSGDGDSAKAGGITYQSGPGIWGFLIVAMLAVGAAVAALLPTPEIPEADLATPPMGIPMPQRVLAPQVAKIPESPLST
jgi:hypothetical protein